MDHTKCSKCKEETRIEIGALPGEGYQATFFINCTECGNIDLLLIDEDNFEVAFGVEEDGTIKFILKGKVEKR